MSSARRAAEARVHDGIRAALPDEYRLYPSVRWIRKEHQDAPARDGETDPVVLHPELGPLIVETKGGRIRRDSQGRWWSGAHQLKTPPFKQAEMSKHALVRKLGELPDWPGHASDIRGGLSGSRPVPVRSRTRASGASERFDGAPIRCPVPSSGQWDVAPMITSSSGPLTIWRDRSMSAAASSGLFVDMAFAPRRAPCGSEGRVATPRSGCGGVLGYQPRPLRSR